MQVTVIVVVMMVALMMAVLAVMLERLKIVLVMATVVLKTGLVMDGAMVKIRHLAVTYYATIMMVATVV